MRRARGYAFLLLIAPALTVMDARRAASQPVLSDSLYNAHHPRLLFARDDVAALRAKLQDGGPDDEAYAFLRTWVQDVYPSQPIAFVLGTSFGFQSIPATGLVGFLESPADSASKVLGRILTTYIADYYDPDFDEAGSGLRLRALALGYDLFFETASPAERARIRDEIVLYIQKMIWNTAYARFEYRPYLGNHSAMFGASLGLAAIVLQGEAEDWLLADAMAMADRIVDNLLMYLFDPGGSYHEGGLYALWTMSNLVYYFDARRRYDGHAFGDNPRVRAMEEWLAYELLPEGRGASHNLNDSPYWTTPFARHSTYFDWAIHEWSSGLSAWLWEHTAGSFGIDLGLDADKVATVLWHRSVPVVEPSAVLPPHRIWLARGLYAFRTGWSADTSSSDVVFSFYSGKFQGGHAQEDQNQFALYAYGEKFAVDHGSGAVAQQSEAHNLVFIDGQGQHNAGAAVGTDGRIAAYLLGASADYVVGDATAAYGTHSEFNDPDQPFPGTDWSWGYSGANPVRYALRRVLVVHATATPPYFVIMDDIDKDGAPHVYEWRMHTLAGNVVDSASDPMTIAGPSGTMDVHLLHPPLDSVSITTKAFDNATPEPNSILLRLANTSIDPAFSVLLIPRPNAVASPPVTRQAYPWGYGCSIAWSEGILDHLIRNDSGVPVSYANIETDARVALVRESGGVVTGYLAADFGSLTIDSTSYATMGDGTATCEVSGPTLYLDRLAAFRILDTGITRVLVHEQEIGFTVQDGYVVPVGTTAVRGGTPPPSALVVRAYPNPFNPSTTIRIEGDPAVRTRAVVFDVAGRRVRSLWDAALHAPSRTLTWDGRDDAGRRAASGVYFLRVSTPSQTRAIKLTILK